MKPYSMQFFIEKYADIPSDYFSLSNDKPSMDAWEWLTDEEAYWLYDNIKDYGILLLVNDGYGACKEYGDHPKQRIVAFLKQVQEAKLEKYGT